MKFRELRADEIDCRVSQITERGLSLLLYKDARVDQTLLDETVGPMNWQRSHQLIGDRLYCTVSIWDQGKGQWISKQDVGTESNTEPEKGQASDSFKRACFNFGIGRELYTAPFIWITPDKCRIVDGMSGKKACYDRFEVIDIAYQDGKITRLVIGNKKETVYTYGANAAKREQAREEAKMIGPAAAGMLLKDVSAAGVNIGALLQMYHVGAMQELTEDQAADIRRKLESNRNRQSNSGGTATGAA